MPDYEIYVTHTIRVQAGTTLQADSMEDAQNKADVMAATGQFGFITWTVEDCHEGFVEWEAEDTSCTIEGPFEV